MAKASHIIPLLLQEYNIPTVHDLEEALTERDTGMIRKLIARDGELTTKAINVIMEKYPDVNPAFLVTGKGRVRMTQAMRKVLGL